MINLCKQMNYAKYKSEQYEDLKAVTGIGCREKCLILIFNFNL